MIRRRGVFVGGAALALMSGTGFATPPDVRFDVMRNGSRIGQQSVTFQQQGAVLQANTTVEIIVRLGPIVLFRYNHSVREAWRDGQFETLDSTTNDDGKPFKVHAERGAAGVAIEASAIPHAVLPPETIPLTHCYSARRGNGRAGQRRHGSRDALFFGRQGQPRRLVR